jgi:hypothetical protein
MCGHREEGNVREWTDFAQFLVCPGTNRNKYEVSQVSLHAPTILWSHSTEQIWWKVLLAQLFLGVDRAY